MKTVTIKLIRASKNTGPFTIKDNFDHIIASDVSKDTLINGISYTVDDDVTIISLTSTGKCGSFKSKSVGIITSVQLAFTPFVQTHTSCLWRHLATPNIFNIYYNNIEPYIIEYPLDFQPLTEILQSVQDFSKVYHYLPDGTGVFNYNDKIEIDNEYFNKLVIYNGQQSSGTLILVPKPIHNLQAYMNYPKYNSDSKTVLYTKSDGFYQTNTFWDIVKDKTKQLFITSCENLSIDRKVNDSNMIYTQQSFHKSPLRAKDVKLRYILDNKSDIHIVSQFILTSNQISYK